jgi:hypothetical protein
MVILVILMCKRGYSAIIASRLLGPAAVFKEEGGWDDL